MTPSPSCARSCAASCFLTSQNYKELSGVALQYGYSDHRAPSGATNSGFPLPCSPRLSGLPPRPRSPRTRPNARSAVAPFLLLLRFLRLEARQPEPAPPRSLPARISPLHSAPWASGRRVTGALVLTRRRHQRRRRLPRWWTRGGGVPRPFVVVMIVLPRRRRVFCGRRCRRRMRRRRGWRRRRVR